jgi:hypothetical protein
MSRYGKTRYKARGYHEVSPYAIPKTVVVIADEDEDAKQTLTDIEMARIKKTGEVVVYDSPGEEVTVEGPDITVHDHSKEEPVIRTQVITVVDDTINQESKGEFAPLNMNDKAIADIHSEEDAKIVDQAGTPREHDIDKYAITEFVQDSLAAGYVDKSDAAIIINALDTDVADARHELRMLSTTVEGRPPTSDDIDIAKLLAGMAHRLSEMLGTVPEQDDSEEASETVVGTDVGSPDGDKSAVVTAEIGEDDTVTVTDVDVKEEGDDEDKEPDEAESEDLKLPSGVIDTTEDEFAAQDAVSDSMGLGGLGNVNLAEEDMGMDNTTVTTDGPPEPKAKKDSSKKKDKAKAKKSKKKAGSGVDIEEA